jgi:hypothetical protein
MAVLLTGAAPAQGREQGDFVAVGEEPIRPRVVAIDDGEVRLARGNTEPGEDIGNGGVVGERESDPVAVGVRREIVGESREEPKADLHR